MTLSKVRKGVFLLILGIATAQITDDVRPGMIHEPGLSFNALGDDDLVVKHWNTALSSVFLKNKLVLTPQLKLLNGYVSSNY